FEAPSRHTGFGVVALLPLGRFWASPGKGNHGACEGLTSVGMPEGYGQGGAGAENSNVMEDHSWREAHMPGRPELNWHDGGLPNDDVRNHHDRRRNRRVPGRGAPDFLSRSSRSKDSSGSKDIAGAKDGVVRAGHWG